MLWSQAANISENMFAEIISILEKCKNNLKEIDQTVCLFLVRFLPFCHVQTSRKLVIATEGKEKFIQI